MYIGSGMFLIIAGAICRYAVNDRVSWLNFAQLGNILMIGGVLLMILGIIRTLMKRRHQGYTQTYSAGIDPNTGQAVERTEMDPH